MRSIILKHQEKIDTSDSLDSLYVKKESSKGDINIFWLGQAGFVIASKHTIIAIDPYLSNVLEEKYRGSETPHDRMMEPPIRSELLKKVDLLLSTHPHTDHFDTGALQVIYEEIGEGSPKIILPRSSISIGVKRGIPLEKMITINSKESFELICGRELIKVSAIQSAHEKLSFDQWGNDLALGYVIEINGLRIYHSGDTLVYSGLTELLTTMKIDLALLPVNGTNDFLSKHAIAGNMNIKEACKLCLDARIPFLIPHHYGMFEFNSVSPNEIMEGLDREYFQQDKNFLLCEPRNLYRIGVSE